MDDVTVRLVKGAVGGDAQQLAGLLERIRPRVVMWATTHLTRSLRAKEDPEDLAQRILFKVYERFDSFAGTDERAFFQWVWQVGRNEIVDLYRYYGAEKRRAEDEAPEEAALGVPAQQSTPSSRMKKSELLAYVRQAVEALPAEMQEVFRLCKLEGRAPSEAAGELGKSVNAVRVMLCRTLRRIRDQLAATGVSFA